MREIGIGRALFAVSFIALGALLIGVHDFAKVWPPLLEGMAGQGTVAKLCGAVLVVNSLGLFFPQTARLSALILTAFLLLRASLGIPNIAAHPLVEANWYEVSESLVFVAGGWMMFSTASGGGALAKLGSARVGQVLFGLALPAIGLSHFFYLGQTAPLIPRWLPFHVALAYFTGAAHIAAGVGILSGVAKRLAATLEAAMVSLFTVLVWLPMVATAPGKLFNWSELFVSTAITGAAWAVAGSLRSAPWGLRRA